MFFDLENMSKIEVSFEVQKWRFWKGLKLSPRLGRDRFDLFLRYPVLRSKKQWFFDMEFDVLDTSKGRKTSYSRPTEILGLVGIQTVKRG